MVFLANSFDNIYGMFASRQSPLCRETVFCNPESTETLRLNYCTVTKMSDHSIFDGTCLHDLCAYCVNVGQDKFFL